MAGAGTSAVVHLLRTARPAAARRYLRVALSAAVQIRAAEPADVELIFSLIVELAEYERAPEQVTGTPELLARGAVRRGARRPRR